MDKDVPSPPPPPPSVEISRAAPYPDIDDPGEQDEQATPPPVSKARSIMVVLVGGMALFSDGYNGQMVGYMNPVLAKLHPVEYDSTMKSRMSSAFLVGEVFGMLVFGWTIDRMGRRTGIVWATVCLVLGLVLASAAYGTSVRGRLWMMIIGRGVAGFGAGGNFFPGFSFFVSLFLFCLCLLLLLYLLHFLHHHLLHLLHLHFLAHSGAHTK